MPAITLYPDARELLEILQGKKKIGLISDGYLETQRNKFTALQLDRYVDRAVFTDAAGRQSMETQSLGVSTADGAFFPARRAVRRM